MKSTSRVISILVILALSFSLSACSAGNMNMGADVTTYREKAAEYLADIDIKGVLLMDGDNISEAGETLKSGSVVVFIEEGSSVAPVLDRTVYPEVQSPDYETIAALYYNDSNGVPGTCIIGVSKNSSSADIEAELADAIEYIYAEKKCSQFCCRQCLRSHGAYRYAELIRRDIPAGQNAYHLQSVYRAGAHRL